MSVWDTVVRADPMVPVALTPLAAADGGPDADGGDGSGGLGLDFFIQLGASIGSLADSISADRADRVKRQRAPGNEQLFKAGVVPASGTLHLDLGSVPQGRVWQVRRLIVGGTTVTTTAAGSAYAFAQGARPLDLALTDCVDIFPVLPRGDTFGTHQLFLLPGEHLWVVFVGATSTQQYSASARVEDWDEATFNSTFSE
jgi:hypothetical protein